MVSPLFFTIAGVRIDSWGAVQEGVPNRNDNRMQGLTFYFISRAKFLPYLNAVHKEKMTRLRGDSLKLCASQTLV
jgi:hypothetical protein